MPRLDPHSFFDPDHGVARHLHLDLDLDFGTHVVDATATLHFAEPREGTLVLDTRDLEILKVTDGEGRDLPWSLGDADPVLGTPLRIERGEPTARVRVRYRTSPGALALQWLSPPMTAGGEHPYVFSQCQPIHARTIVPLQDSPRVRVRYTANVTVPEPLVAVMSAASVGDGPGPRPGTRTWRFEMPQPIPSYLLALAVGHLASRDLDPRCRIWAEPEVLEAAAWEFAGIGDMLREAEKLFGPYEWDRFDMLVLPPAFPYGGMENPRLTFLTPTLLAGDRSLVNVAAHELAHSWTGNLVTNATMNDFWLNEGFTVYAERRILEALEGEEYAALHAVIGYRSLLEDMERFGMDSPFTRLHTDLAGIDPDSVYSLVPYEKGFLFLTLVERTIGREAWDRFLGEYIRTFRFQSITTEEFRAFFDEQLPGVAEKVRADEWIEGTGLPDNCPEFRSERLEKVEALVERFTSEGMLPTRDETDGWSPEEWQIFLKSLPREIDPDACRRLDETFGLTGSGNYEILVNWLVLAARSGYEPALPRVREVLLGVGRMKYLKPLYEALVAREETRALAREVFEEAKDRYHPIARAGIEAILAT